MDMKESYKLLVSKAIFAIMLLAAGIIIGGANSATDSQTAEGAIKYSSLVQVYKNGDQVWQGHNLITNLGKEMLEAATGNPDSINANATIQTLGNTTAPAVGDTTLPGIISSCGLAAKKGSYSSNSASNGNWTLSSTWTSTCDNQIVNTTGLYNMSSSGNLFAGTSFTSTTLQTNDQITVNYTVWVA